MATTDLTTGLSDALKYKYTEAFEVNIEKEHEVLDLFKTEGRFKTIDGPDGKGIVMSHNFHSGGGVVFGNESDYMPTNNQPSVKQSVITLKKQMAVVQMTGHVMRRMKDDAAAFADWAKELLPRRAERAAWHEDRAALGFGAGYFARVNEASPDTSLVIDSPFGIAGLTGAARLVHSGDSFRASPNANGTSPRTGTAVINSIEFDTSVLNIDALPTSTADNDYLFIGDTNVYGLGTREPMGLEGIVDDGNILGTFQTLSRTTYPQLKAQQIDASTTTWGSTLTEDLLDYAATQAFHRAGGKIDVIVGNASANRSYWKSIRGDRSINDPRGNYEGGKRSLKCILGGKVVELRDARKVPDERVYLLDRSTIRKFQLGKGKWDDTEGTVWQRAFDSTGLFDAFRAFYIKEYELGCGDPAKNVKLTGIASA